MGERGENRVEVRRQKVKMVLRLDSGKYFSLGRQRREHEREMDVKIESLQASPCLRPVSLPQFPSLQYRTETKNRNH